MNPKKTALFQLFALIIFSLNSFGQNGQIPPFTIQIEPVIANPLPAIHSFAFAKSGDKWLIIGGRTNGLHGLNSSGSFPPEYINNSVMVIDTTTWNFYQSDLNQLIPAIADPMRSTNMQYIQEGNYLYMIGGYGYDSVADLFVTFPNLTAIHVDNMINAVINAQPIATTIRQVNDTNFAICGGDLGKIGNDYYLMFGHNFRGFYADPPVPIFTQKYSDKIKKFDINDDGTTITLSSFSYQTDTNNFHRRDFNTGPIIKPDGSFAIGAYGGVFRKDSNLPFQEPIIISASGASVDISYKQVMSQYTCAIMPIYDSISQKMYTTFFGGISLYNYNDATNLLKRDSLVPFINDLTTMTLHSDGSIEETILPIKLPGLLGSNAKFIPTQHVSSYANEVIRLRDLPNAKTMVGYILGGIRAQQGNFGISWANDSIYRVFITPTIYTLNNEIANSIQNLQLFPNPTNQQSTLMFYLKSAEQITFSVQDVFGKSIMKTVNENFSKGNQKININTSELKSGIYICKIQSESVEQIIKLIITR